MRDRSMGESSFSETVSERDKPSQIRPVEGRQSESVDNIGLLRDFFQRLTAYVKARRLYPPDHVRPKKQLESWFEATKKILALYEEVTIFIRTECVELCGFEFGKGEKVIADFIPEFIKRSLRFVALKRGAGIEDLKAFGELFLRDPEEIAHQGGPCSFIEQLGAERVFVVEYAEEAKKLLEDLDNIETLRQLARIGGSKEREVEVVKWLIRKRLKEEELNRVRKILEKEGIRDRFEALRDALAKVVKEVDPSLVALDLAIELIKQAHSLKAALPDGDEAEESEATGYLLDLARQRICEILSDEQNPQSKELKEQITRTALSEEEQKKSLITMLFGDSHLELPTHASLLVKEILKKSREERASLGLGPIFDQKAAEIKEQTFEVEAPSIDLDSLREKWKNFTSKVGQAVLKLDKERMSLAYVDILLEILKKERPGPLRARIRKKLEEKLASLCEGENESIRTAVTKRLLEESAGLGREDLGELLQNEAILDQAIRDFLTGDRRWESFLRTQAKIDRMGFAEKLADAVFKSKSAPQEECLTLLVRECGSAIVGEVRKRLRAGSGRVPVRKVFELLKPCRCTEAIGAMAELLGKVPPTHKWELMESMVRINADQALGILGTLMLEAPVEDAVAIIHFLGGQKHPIAQDALLNFIESKQTTDKKKELRIEAVSALERIGNLQAACALEDSASKLSLLLTKHGRKLRKTMRSVAKSIRERVQRSSN